MNTKPGPAGQMTNIEVAREQADLARVRAVECMHARKAGSPDRATALRLEEDWVAAASAARFYDEALAELLKAEA